MHALGCLFILFIIGFVLLFSIVRGVLSFLFGGLFGGLFRRRDSRRQSYYDTGYDDSKGSDTAAHDRQPHATSSNKRKLIGEDEGEYVDYEEVE